jgi:hypothetical protein
MFCFLDGIAKTNKKGYSDHFAHLETGKVSLPSAVDEALGKEATFAK